MKDLREIMVHTYVKDIADDIVESMRDNNEKRLLKDISKMRKQLEDIESEIYCSDKKLYE